MIRNPSLGLNCVAFPFAAAACVAMVQVHEDTASQALMVFVVIPICYEYWRIDSGGRMFDKICKGLIAAGVILGLRWWINEMFVVRWEMILPAWLIQTVGARPYLTLGVIVGAGILITSGRGGRRR